MKCFALHSDSISVTGIKIYHIVWTITPLYLAFHHFSVRFLRAGIITVDDVRVMGRRKCSCNQHNQSFPLLMPGFRVVCVCDLVNPHVVCLYFSRRGEFQGWVPKPSLKREGGFWNSVGKDLGFEISQHI